MAIRRRIPAGVDKDAKNRERLRLYAIAAGILVVIAIVSTLLTDVSVNSGRCSGGFQQQEYNCIEQLAYSNSNATMCSSLPSSYADQCYANIAENTKNASTCSRISNGSTYGTCIMYIANVTKNTSLCGKLNSSLNDYCIDQLAIGSMNPHTCIQLNAGYTRSVCLSAVYMGKAMENGNSSACAMIPSNNNSNVTFSSVSALSAFSSSNYINVTQVLSYASLSNITLGTRDACYLSLAYDSLDKGYCADVSANESVLCNATATRFNTISYNSTALATNYTTFMTTCEKQANYTQCIDAEYYMQASSAKNVSGCENLTSVYAYQCYYTLAQEYNDINYCSYITNSTLNADCITAIKSGEIGNTTNPNN